MRGQSMALATGTNTTLPIPASAGGALDIAVSFDLGPLSAAASGFGIAVRAPNAVSSVGGIELSFAASAPDATGTRVVSVAQSFGSPPAAVSAGDTALEKDGWFGPINEDYSDAQCRKTTMASRFGRARCPSR